MPIDISSSSASDNRIAAADQATVVRGRGKVIRAGAVDLQNAKVNSGLDLKNFKGTLSITTNQDSSPGLVEKLTGFFSSVPSSTPSPPASPAPATTTTDPATTADPVIAKKKWLWLAVLLAAGAAYYFFKKRR